MRSYQVTAGKVFYVCSHGSVGAQQPREDRRVPMVVRLINKLVILVIVVMLQLVQSKVSYDYSTNIITILLELIFMYKNEEIAMYSLGKPKKIVLRIISVYPN